MSNRLKPIPFKFAKGWMEAINALRADGYSDDGSLSKISCMRQAIRDAWEVRFPGIAFPPDTYDSEGEPLPHTDKTTP